MSKKYDRKHLTFSQRVTIEKGLDSNESFTSIAARIGKDPSTVSKEVRRHLAHHTKCENGRAVPCTLRSDCQRRTLCGDTACPIICKICRKPGLRCTDICPDYVPETCEKLEKPPYVCNACKKRSNCLMERAFYFAKYADDTYRVLLVSSRDGINQTPADIAMLDAMVSPLLKKGQSIAHIYANHASEIPCCRKTLYNYIDRCVFSARNIDMRRRVRYKVRKKPTRVSLSAREFRIGRNYDDFQKLLKENPSLPVVEMDTVEGSKKNGSKVFLTMLFRNCSLMLIFLLEEKTQACVTEVFDLLTRLLGIDAFRELFQVILTDNGTEFQNPVRLESTEDGEMRTKIYFCNPHSSWQKGMIEKNHEYIRLVIPKGRSLDCYHQEDAVLLMNHINSEARDSLHGCNPYRLSLMLLNHKLHEVLHLEEIPPDEVTLCPNLLKK